jgi:hypothetical protein
MKVYAVGQSRPRNRCEDLNHEGAGTGRTASFAFSELVVDVATACLQESGLRIQESHIRIEQ